MRVLRDSVAQRRTTTGRNRITKHHASISWFIAQVDWHEVREGLIAFLALLITAAQYVWRAALWCWAHREQLNELFVYRYEPTSETKLLMPAAPVAPAIKPLHAMQSLSCL